MRRTGIDLSSTRCYVVDAESSGRRRNSAAAVFRVRDYAAITHLDNAETLAAELKALAERGTFSRRAWVNLWGVRSSHQYLLLPSAPDPELESKARRHGASLLGISDLDVTVATSLGATRGEPGHHPRREVSFFAASSVEIRAGLRAIVEAGFLIEGVTTPCGALWSQSLVRRASLPGEVHAHVALGVSQSALGIFSEGVLLYARDLDWGYATRRAGAPITHEREALADRLSLELRRSFLYLKQYWETDVSQVLLCGDMAEIRSLTAPLIERLNIEVETLDTLDGIDAETLPEGFADHAPAFRLASSIAVQPPPVNLLPVEVTASRTSVTGLRIVAAGTAAAIVVAAVLSARANIIRADLQRDVDEARGELSSPAHPSAPAQEPTTVARLFEGVAGAAAPGVTLKSLRADPSGADWKVRVEVFASGADETTARRAADRFMSTVAESSTSGVSLRTTAGEFTAAERGMEITAEYLVRK